MNVGKWNYDKHDYEPYELPSENCAVFTGNDMNALLDCAGCGKTQAVGGMFTSMQVHALPSGFGYNVCAECHELEWTLRKDKEGIQ